jgi:regulator of nucleoside diphosphate kinase
MAPALSLRQDLRYNREINDGDVARCDIRSPIVDFHGMRAAWSQAGNPWRGVGKPHAETREQSFGASGSFFAAGIRIPARWRRAMSKEPRYRLTMKDYLFLDAMLKRRIGSDDPLIQRLRHKLSMATVVAREDIRPRVAAIGSRVEYSVDEGPIEIRILVHDEEGAGADAALSVAAPRGLALLGLAEGDRITIDGLNGRREALRLENVHDQPEATETKGAHQEPVPQDGHSRPAAASVIDLRARRRAAEPGSSPAGRRGPDDDPGPSAA